MSLFFFQHDCKSASDAKILVLEEEFGVNVGYALYFKTLEIMTELGGYLPADCVPALSRSCQRKQVDMTDFLNYCVEIGLFCLSDSGYYSERFVQWLSEKCAIVEKRRLAGKAGAEKRYSQPAKPEKASKASKEPNMEIDVISEEETASESASAIFAQIDALWLESGEVALRRKNKARNLKGKQIDKLVTDFGMDRLVIAIPIFYTWKWSSNRDVISDYRSIRQDWVWEKVAKTQSNEKSGISPQSTTYEQRKASWDAAERERIAKATAGLTEQQIKALGLMPKEYKGE